MTAASATHGDASYASSGVDTDAGDRAVELMKASVAATQGPEVLGGVGGFAGLFDASAVVGYRRPLLATSTDGVGTKIALAIALDKHDTIGQDLVGMVVDDIVVVGARPLYLTDYIACGRVVPERIAAIVSGIAHACTETGTALLGGETAEHPGVMAPDEYDIAAAVTGVVEADELLGAARVQHGDVVIAIASSGLHANGYSLVRHILATQGRELDEQIDEFGRSLGEELLEPTRLYAAPVLALLDAIPGAVHAMSHVTGGGIAANLARVLPEGSWVEVDRSTWSPQPVFRVLADWGGLTLAEVEGTWNVGVGLLAVVAADAASSAIHELALAGLPAWAAGRVTVSARDVTGFVAGAKGVAGGAVRLVGRYAD